VNPTGFQCDGCELWLPAKGVKKCYAGRFAERVGGVGAFDKPIQLKPGRMAEAARWGNLRGKARAVKPWIPTNYPRLVFIGDMADTFSRGVPFEYLKTEVTDTVRRWPHIGLWLTKQPKRMAEFSDWLLKAEGGANWLGNLWAGTTVTSPDKLYRIVDLGEVGDFFTTRFVSFEPLLGKGDWTPLHNLLAEAAESLQSLLDWAIIGGESGHGAGATDLASMAELISILTNAGVKVFVKQLGSRPVRRAEDEPFERIVKSKLDGTAGGHEALPMDKKGGDWSEWPSDFQRREFPVLDL